MGMLDGKVAFITGGASGIGEGTACRFAEQGAKVALADVQDEAGEKIRGEIERAGGEAFYVHCDVSEPESVRAAIKQTVARFGKLDIVFANAGIPGVWAPIDAIQPDEWDRTLTVNLKGTYLTVHFAVPHLKKNGGGSIIITSSVSGNRTFGQPGATAYSTSKAGQVAFMKMIALELGRHNIRCNAICPGGVDTPIAGKIQERDTNTISMTVELPRGSPAVNAGQNAPGDIADTCLFLASDLSRHVSGVEIYQDGGASLLR